MNIFLVGGFLGSGKTTAIAQAVALLHRERKIAGVVTNDQGDQLVDTKFLQGEAIQVREVTGSCFCCNFGALEKSIRSLSSQSKPDVIFAESVGSCTDLVATIVKPLQRYYPDEFRVVLSVFVDIRSLAVYLFKEEPLFRDTIDYIFEKQLEEADIIVVNKSDLVDPGQLTLLRQAVEDAYGDKRILYQNSLTEAGVQDWLDAAWNFDPGKADRRSLDIDYDRYGAGEAELAWLDGEIGIDTNDRRAVEIGLDLVDRIHSRILAAGYPIGHLKFLLSDGLWQEKISFTSIPDRVEVSTPEPSHPFPGNRPGPPSDENRPGPSPDGNRPRPSSDRVALLVNARVQTLPATLQGIVSDCILELEAAHQCRITEGRWDSRAPGYPRPTYRI